MHQDQFSESVDHSCLCWAHVYFMLTAVSPTSIVTQSFGARGVILRLECMIAECSWLFLCFWLLCGFPPTLGSYSCVSVKCHSSSHTGHCNNRYILSSSRWLDNTFLGLFKSSEAFLKGILDKEERNFQSRQKFGGTLAKCQDPKYLDQNGLVKTGKTNSLL